MNRRSEICDKSAFYLTHEETTLKPLCKSTPARSQNRPRNKEKMILTFISIVLGALFCGADALYSRDLDDMLQMLKQRQRLTGPQSMLPFIVNPFSPVLLCDWHYNNGSPDTFGGDPILNEIVTNPLNMSNIGNVKACESICVDATAFNSFATDILPLIRTKILLFSHRWCLPQVHKSHLTDLVRSHPNVSHWFAQNPVYIEDGKYSAFPYGIEAGKLRAFGDALLAYHQGSKQKNTTIEHLHVSSSHPSRLKLINKRAEIGGGLFEVQEFYEKVAASRFLISPHGDRPDCYRHWEAIGLGAIPVSNIDPLLYGPLFGNDMMYVGDTDKMIELLDDPRKLDLRYHAPQSQRVLTRYWTQKVDEEKRRCVEW